MLWILFAVAQVVVIVSGIRGEQRAGLWSWSKFAFAIGFAVLEGAIVTIPIVTMDIRGPHFLPVFISAWVVAALNFVWMILVARRWKLPDGRSSLQAYRDMHK